jgi:hypothetical protein
MNWVPLKALQKITLDRIERHQEFLLNIITGVEK